MSFEVISPTLFSMGSGGLIGFLVGFAIKRVFRILAVIVGTIPIYRRREYSLLPGNAGHFFTEEQEHDSFAGWRAGRHSACYF